jgi:DNA-binding NtrC family response regulator
MRDPGTKAEQRAAETGRAPLVGSSTALQRLREGIRRVAGTPGTTVLVQAEPGAGGETVARTIHACSGPPEAPFQALECRGRLAKELGPELAGAAELGGTLWLDGVEALDDGLQAQLLALLERQPRPAHRTVAGTSVDLEELVEVGRFRPDLLYRLNVLTLRVPALRERPQDLPELANHLLRGHARRHARPPVRLVPAALEVLAGHGWPGNTLELAAVLELALLRCSGGEIGPRDVDPRARRAGEAPRGDLRTMERAWILQVLEECGGNRSRASRALGINRATLYNKLRRYGAPLEP